MSDNIYERDESIRLSVCYCTSAADIKIHAQVYDTKNRPRVEIGNWSLAEFAALAPTILRAYWCGRRAERMLNEELE
jgi:hypothetical protein